MSKRNFGYGRKMAYAGKMALRQYYGGGHYGTVASHASRWSVFCTFARGEGIVDMRRVTPELGKRFAASTAGLAVSTRQNLLSTVNVVMTFVTRGQWQKLSPAALVGHRHTLRTTVPGSLSRSVHDAAIRKMEASGMVRAAAIAELARDLGVRSREAVLADLDRWADEAKLYDKVNVLDGTKGGRSAPRWVRLSDAGKRALTRAISVRPDGSKNLLSPQESYKQARDGWIRAGREVYGKAVGAHGFHDARSSYGCERYWQMTHCVAPVVAGHRVADPDSDRSAREVLAYELGHNRIDVVASYIGGRR